MKQSTTQYEDVVIVGAGPVGLAAAAEFANLGIQPVVLEASNSFSDGSKAICWSQRTLEILNRTGSAKKMLEKGYDVQTIHELTELSVEEIEMLK